MAYELYKTVQPFEVYFNEWDRQNKDLGLELKQYIYAKYLLKCKVFKRDSYTCQNIECQWKDTTKQWEDIKRHEDKKCDCEDKDCDWEDAACISKGRHLTLHHIRWQKDGGGHSHTNGVTLCNTCHQGYHRAKRSLVFADAKYLPNRLRGRTFKLKKKERLNWKQIKSEMNKMRKALKFEHGIVLSDIQMRLLMRFITIPYSEWDD